MSPKRSDTRQFVQVAIDPSQSLGRSASRQLGERRRATVTRSFQTTSVHSHSERNQDYGSDFLVRNPSALAGGIPNIMQTMTKVVRPLDSL